MKDSLMGYQEKAEEEYNGKMEIFAEENGRVVRGMVLE